MMGGAANTSTDNKSKISAIYSTKKIIAGAGSTQGHEKFGKAQKKLPDLTMGHYEGSKGRNIGMSSDSDEQNKQLPLIKGGFNAQNSSAHHHNNQVTEAYSMKSGPPTKKQSTSFN